jgi:N-formylglutamate amidohydrolase
MDRADPGAIGAAFGEILSLTGPARPATPLVLGSPHSGDVYPADFVSSSRLPAQTLRRSEDAHVDALATPAAEALGAPLLAARFPRAFLDVNREPFELDPRLFDGRLPAFANTRSLRVAGGLGVVPRIVGEGLEIYARRLPLAEGLARIEALHAPYHDALEGLLARARAEFGLAVLIDCHSMPAAPTQRAAGERLDIVVGDRFGSSAAPELVAAVVEAFRQAGRRVGLNKPYAGGYVTERHGRPAQGLHAIQIEIARDLYMDERTLQPHGGFDRVAADLTAACAAAARVCAELARGSVLSRQAAE